MRTTTRPARERRSAAVAVWFDPQRMTLARQLRGLSRTDLARRLAVTPAAISQYECGQTRPTLPTIAGLALALGMPPEFFTLARPLQSGMASSPHFRSLRTTSQVDRDRALAFAALAADVLDELERRVVLPQLLLPDLRVPGELCASDIRAFAQQSRDCLGVKPGPVPHLVRVLELAGVLVLQLPDVSQHVDAFSAHLPSRPVVLLNPAKQDAARSRFDAAHELAHLVMHFGTEPGSRLVENDADRFAADFLMPAEEIAAELPERLDWDELFWLKPRWGVSLRALLLRAHHLGIVGDADNRRGMEQLRVWGYPEPAPLRSAEAPTLLGLARDVLQEADIGLSDIAADLHLPLELLTEVIEAGTDRRRRQSP